MELASFTATEGDGQVVLHWATEGEMDNLGFRVYRSLAEEANVGTQVRMSISKGNSMETTCYGKEISSSIEELGEDILAGYIFGSTLKSYKFKDDLDIGLLLEEDALKDGTLNIQNRFYLGLKNSLERGDIDVVILNNASLLLRYAVIKEGVLVYERDRDRRIEFEVSTMLAYFDFSHIRRMFWQDMSERLRDGRFAKPNR